MVGVENEGPAPPSAKELAKVASSLPPSAPGNVSAPASGISNSSQPAVAPATPVLAPSSTPSNPSPGTYRGSEAPSTQMSFADYLAKNNIFYRDSGVPYIQGQNVNTEQVQKQISILQEKYAGISNGQQGGTINSVDKALQTAKENFGITYQSGGGGGEKSGGASARDIYVATALGEYEKGYVASSQKDIGQPAIQNLGTLLGKVGLRLNTQTGVIDDPLMAGIIAHDIVAASQGGYAGISYSGGPGPETPQSKGRDFGWRALNYGQGLVPQQFNGDTIYVSQAQAMADILARQNNKEYGGKQEFLVGNIGTENVTGSTAALYPKQQEGKKQTIPQANLQSTNETPLINVGGHLVLASLNYTPSKEAVESANIARQNVNNVLLQRNLNERANAGIDALASQDKQLNDFFANVSKSNKVDTIDIYGEFQNNESVFPAHQTGSKESPLSFGATNAEPTSLRLLESVPVSKGEKGLAEVLAKYSGNSNLVSPSGKVNWTNQQQVAQKESPLSVTLVARSSNPNAPGSQDKGLGITNLYGLAGNRQQPNVIEKAMGKTETDYINAAVNTLTTTGISIYGISAFVLNQLGVQAGERVSLAVGIKAPKETPLSNVSEKTINDLPPSVDYLKGKGSGEGLAYDVGFVTGDIMQVLGTGGLSTAIGAGRLAGRGLTSMANRARLELAFGGVKGMVYNKNYGLDVEAEATLVPRGEISYEAGGLRTASTLKSLNPMRTTLPSDLLARDYAEISTGSATQVPPPSPASVTGEQSVFKAQQEKLLEPVSTKTQPNQPVNLDPFYKNVAPMKSLGPTRPLSSGAPTAVNQSALAPSGVTPIEELVSGVPPLSYGESVMNYYKSFTTKGSTGFASSTGLTTTSSKLLSPSSPSTPLPSGPSPLDLMIENQVYGVNLLKGGEEPHVQYPRDIFDYIEVTNPKPENEVFTAKGERKQNRTFEDVSKLGALGKNESIGILTKGTEHNPLEVIKVPMKSLGKTKATSGGASAKVDIEALLPRGVNAKEDEAAGVSPFILSSPSGISRTPLSNLKESVLTNETFRGGHIKNFYPAYKGAVNPSFKQGQLLEVPPNEFQTEKDKFQKLGVKSFLPPATAGTSAKGYYLTAKGQKELLNKKLLENINKLENPTIQDLYVGQREKELLKTNLELAPAGKRPETEAETLVRQSKPVSLKSEYKPNENVWKPTPRQVFDINFQTETPIFKTKEFTSNELSPEEKALLERYPLMTNTLKESPLVRGVLPKTGLPPFAVKHFKGKTSLINPTEPFVLRKASESAPKGRIENIVQRASRNTKGATKEPFEIKNNKGKKEKGGIDVFYSPTQNIRQFFERLESTNYNYGNNPNLRQGITKETIPYKTKNKTKINTNAVLGIETEPSIGEAKDRLETIMKGDKARQARESKFIKPSFNEEKYSELTKKELQLSKRMKEANEKAYLKRISKDELNLLERTTNIELKQTRNELDKLEALKPVKKQTKIEENFRAFSTTSHMKSIKPDLSNYHNIGQNQILEPPQVKPPPEPPKVKQRQDYGMPNPAGPEALSGEAFQPSDVLKPATRSPIYIPLHVQKNKSALTPAYSTSLTLGQEQKPIQSALGKQGSLSAQVFGQAQVSGQVLKPAQQFKQDQQFKQTSRQLEQPKLDVPLFTRQPQVQALATAPVNIPRIPPKEPPKLPPDIITGEPKRRRYPEKKKKKEDNANFLGNVSEYNIAGIYNRTEVTYGISNIAKLTSKDISRARQGRGKFETTKPNELQADALGINRTSKIPKEYTSKKEKSHKTNFQPKTARSKLHL